MMATDVSPYGFDLCRQIKHIRNRLGRLEAMKRDPVNVEHA